MYGNQQYYPYSYQYPYSNPNPINYAAPVYGQTTYSPSPQTTLHGRVVPAESDILPNEVVMDGTVSFFPLQDGSKVIGKQWNSDGTIKTYVFELHNDSPDIDSDELGMDETILSRLDAIEEKLDMFLDS